MDTPKESEGHKRGPLQKSVFICAVVIAVGVGGFALLETYLRHLGYGNPPLYEYDPAVGYLLKRNQDLSRNRGCRVRINNLGMRSPDTSREKPAGIYRVLVLGDSVPFGGSYIDQDDTFCYVAERLLNDIDEGYQVLNAGVNALGPQNVRKLLETRGTYSADLIIVYFPWGNLARGFTNFYIVPFWSNSPGWATAEFMRHVIWMWFGKLSKTWKEISHFQNDIVLKQNLEALKAIKSFCDERRTPVFFLWSPGPDDLAGKKPDILAYEKNRLSRALPPDVLVDLGPQFNQNADFWSLFVDGCHYSRAGHLFAGKVLRDFVRSWRACSDPKRGVCGPGANEPMSEHVPKWHDPRWMRSLR